MWRPSLWWVKIWKATFVYDYTNQWRICPLAFYPRSVDHNGGNNFPKVLYILRTVFWCCIWFQQGAGLELQRVTSRDREKSMLDRQHEHLIRCLEKATVSKHKKNENKYWIVSPSDNPITTILKWPLLPQDKTSWYLKEWYRSPAHMWLGRNIIRQLHIEESLCQQHFQSI